VHGSFAVRRLAEYTSRWDDWRSPSELDSMRPNSSVLSRLQRFADLLESASVARAAYDRNDQPNARHRRTLGIDSDRFPWIGLR
jgi:hypothetical protein